MLARPPDSIAVYIDELTLRSWNSLIPAARAVAIGMAVERRNGLRGHASRTPSAVSRPPDAQHDRRFEGADPAALARRQTTRGESADTRDARLALVATLDGRLAILESTDRRHWSATRP